MLSTKNKHFNFSFNVLTTIKNVIFFLQLQESQKKNAAGESYVNVKPLSDVYLYTKSSLSKLMLILLLSSVTVKVFIFNSITVNNQKKIQDYNWFVLSNYFWFFKLIIRLCRRLRI